MNPFERIRRSVRDSNGRPLTVQEMSAAIGCSYGAWYNAENGYTEEPSSLIEALVALDPEKFSAPELLTEYMSWRSARLDETREAIRAS